MNCWSCGSEWETPAGRCPACGATLRALPWRRDAAPAVPGTPARSRGGALRGLALLVVAAVVATGLGAGAAALVHRLAIGRGVPVGAAGGTATSRALARVASADLPGIVTIMALGRSGEELGTGWAVDRNGDFLTNDHVVRAGISFRVVTSGDQQFVAYVVRVDVRRDLALVHAAGLVEPPLAIARGAARLGQPVVVLAARGATNRPPVTDARVVGLDQAATVTNPAPTGPRNYAGLIRLDAHIFPGNSGGPVLSARGRVVGILTLAAQNGVGAFAIPISAAEPDLRSWLG